MDPSQSQIPTTPPERIETSDATHNALRIFPEGGESRGYHFVAPKTWHPAAMKQKVESTLGEVQVIFVLTESANVVTPKLLVEWLPVPVELAIDVWAQLYLESQGWIVVEQAWRQNSDAQYFFDIVARRRQGLNEAELSRTFVRYDQNRVMILRGQAQVSDWDRYKETIWLAGSTFSPIDDSWQPQAEAWSISQNSQLGYSFAYPQSWSEVKLDVPVNHVGATDITMVDPDSQASLAYIRVIGEQDSELVKASLEHRVEHAKDMMAAAGFVTPREPEIMLPIDDGRRFLAPGWLGTYRMSGTIDEEEYEVRISISVHQEIAFTCFMVAPPLNDNPVIYLAARRVLEIARETLS